ncbi:MAG TPA: helix-turn-helix domain-containing protein [Jatrophihabitans sp.]|nr:helix-turn-helix domain-containing protein [Jatrophihabitans sp.]
MSLHGSTPRRDPLTEIVLCPTTGRAQPVVERTEPVLPTGNRVTGSRAATGLRTRAVIIDGARKAVAASGARITMAEIAARAGVAKATLYNHFRTREEVLAALLLAEIDTQIAAVSHLRLADALTAAALAVSEHPLLEALGEQDGTALAVLARVDVRSAGWARVAQATDRLLAGSGRRGTPTVLRWLSSFVIGPAGVEDIATDVAILIAGLPPAR